MQPEEGKPLFDVDALFDELDHEEGTMPPARSEALFERVMTDLAGSRFLARLHEPERYEAALKEAIRLAEEAMSQMKVEGAEARERCLLARACLDRLYLRAMREDEPLSEPEMAHSLRLALRREALRYKSALLDPGEPPSRAYEPSIELCVGEVGRVLLARTKSPAIPSGVALLKVLHPGSEESPELVELFLDEARAASLARHPNLCVVYDLGRIGGSQGIALEHLHGEHLGALLAATREAGSQGEEGAPRDPDRFAIFSQILLHACDGLHASHLARASERCPARAVHRDLSAHNLFVTAEGGVKVVDFDTVLAAHQAQASGLRWLSPKRFYMSPERVLNRPFKPRMDIWALGVILWEVAAGRPLFQEPTLGRLLLSILEQPIPPPSSVAPDVPEEVDRIVGRALSRDAAERYSTVRDMRRDLAVFLGSHDARVGPSELASWVRRLAGPSLRRKVEERARALSAPALAEAVRSVRDM